jgi:dTDP-4-amino-4,6-dideoxygalactose transaminase
LSGRWIGQGPKVELFENKMKDLFLGDFSPLAVGSGTDALHLAYLLAGIREGDEVISPVFTCTATNIPLLYIGAKIVFADIDPETMNLSVEDVERKITSKTKAIIPVHLYGQSAELSTIIELCEKYNLHLRMLIFNI